LVGDRTFWTTRPYIWYKLLAAKVLFVASWMAVPFAISQVVLLLADHRSLSPHLGRIILDTGGVMLVGVLPVVALAAITRTLGQWVLCAVSLILVAIGFGALDSYIPDSHVPIGYELSDTLLAIVFTC